MTPEQIAEAQKLAREFMIFSMTPNHPRSSAKLGSMIGSVSVIVGGCDLGNEDSVAHCVGGAPLAFRKGN